MLLDLLSTKEGIILADLSDCTLHFALDFVLKFVTLQLFFGSDPLLTSLKAVEKNK